MKTEEEFILRKIETESHSNLHSLNILAAQPAGMNREYSQKYLTDLIGRENSNSKISLEVNKHKTALPEYLMGLSSVKIGPESESNPDNNLVMRQAVFMSGTQLP